MQPKVSGIMPCRGRVEYAREALACFNSQAWTDKELVVVDDEEVLAFPDGIDQPNVIYRRIPDRKSVGLKRNMCCEVATGVIIQHYDSDDWSGPGRMADQVEFLLAHPKLVMVGYSVMVFASRDTREAWVRQGSVTAPCGTSMTYWKSWWEQNKFRNASIGEDVALYSIAARTGQLRAMSNMGRTHPSPSTCNGQENLG